MQIRNGIPKRTVIAIGLLTLIIGFVGGVLSDDLGSAGKQTPGVENLDYSEVEEVYDMLRSKYDGELDPETLIEGAKSGLTGAVGDPFTVYLDEKEAKEFKKGLEGTFSGIGAEIAIKNDQLVVVSPLKGFPAEKAGLRASDAIIAINDAPTAPLTINEAVNKIRGKEGTEVTLTIQRGRKTKEIVIERGMITVDSVSWEIKEGNIGYIEISRFGSDTASLLRQAANEMNQGEVEQIVLDFRNNPGGLLETAVEVAGFFIENKVVVEQRSDGEVTQTLRSGSDAPLQGKELVVLINGGSASASEIVAGALKDHGVATVVGEQSFGKGSVQSLENLSDGQLKVTVARWFTPNGNNIDKEGISPDVKVELTEEDFNNDRDPQLNRALQILKSNN